MLKINLKKEFIGWLATLPLNVHMTIRFAKGFVGLPLWPIREHASWFVRCINSKLYGRRSKNNTRHIKGFAFREMPESYVHYHLLIMHPGKTEEEFRRAVFASLPRVHLWDSNTPVLDMPTIKPITHTIERLNGYCVKDMKWDQGQLNLDDMAILDKDGLPDIIQDFKTIMRNYKNKMFNNFI